MSPSSRKGSTASDLVSYFHEQAGHSASHAPLPKEFHQAGDLIEAHGPDRARRIVRFALDRAAETRFLVRHFGSVLAYIPEAVAALDVEDRYEAARAAGHDTFERHDAERRAELAAFQQLPFDERVAQRLKRYPPALFTAQRLSEIRSRIEFEESERCDNT